MITYLGTKNTCLTYPFTYFIAFIYTLTFNLYNFNN